MWWIEPTTVIEQSWVDAILSDSNTVYVSAVVAMEIETKKRIGKLVFGHDVVQITEALEFESFGVSLTHASIAGSLIWEHRDPFDRMLAAQSIADDMTLVTADEALRSAPGVRVL
jgi:PIN domain nuclease of toxin-antitoxin system